MSELPKINTHWLRHYFCRGCRVRLYKCLACPYCGGPIIDISGNVRIGADSHDDEIQKILDAGGIGGRLSGPSNLPNHHWGSWRDS